jgi:hypothetical protein
MAKNTEIVADIKDVKNNPDHWIEQAKENLVVVREGGENKIVMVNAEVYLRLKRQVRESMLVTDMTEEQVASIRDNKHMAPDAHLYNDEAKDWKG